MKIKKSFEKSKKIEIIKYNFKRALKAAAIFCRKFVKKSLITREELEKFVKTWYVLFEHDTPEGRKHISNLVKG